jgi:hypothetical protein
MPYYNENTRQRVADLVLGLRVDKPAAAVAIDADPGAPFWQVNGLCVVTGIIGVCTVAAGGGNNMFFRFNPDGAAATSDLTATADLGTTAVEGDVHTLLGAAASTLGASDLGTRPVGPTGPVAVYNGVIGLVADAALGTWKWFIYYVPAEAGASITLI